MQKTTTNGQQRDNFNQVPFSQPGLLHLATTIDMTFDVTEITGDTCPAYIPTRHDIARLAYSYAMSALEIQHGWLRGTPLEGATRQHYEYACVQLQRFRALLGDHAEDMLAEAWGDFTRAPHDMNLHKYEPGIGDEEVPF